MPCRSETRYRDFGCFSPCSPLNVFFNPGNVTLIKVASEAREGHEGFDVSYNFEARAPSARASADDAFHVLERASDLNSEGQARATRTSADHGDVAGACLLPICVLNNECLKESKGEGLPLSLLCLNGESMNMGKVNSKVSVKSELIKVSKHAFNSGESSFVFSESQASPSIEV